MPNLTAVELGIVATLQHHLCMVATALLELDLFGEVISPSVRDEIRQIEERFPVGAGVESHG